MHLLVNYTPRTIVELTSEELYKKRYGYLMTPRRWSTPLEGSIWAADNDAFSSWDEDKFCAMVKCVREFPNCKFISTPDIVGDARGTYDRFLDWYPFIQGYNLPVGYVLQDGQDKFDVPYDLCDAVFIGGTTEFKMSEAAAQLALEAKDMGKWVHMGRVNSNGRIKYAQALECDSIDGSGYSKWKSTKIPATIPILACDRKPLYRGLLWKTTIL